MTSSHKVLFGFHAVGVRLKTAPASIVEVFVDPSRRDARMKQFLARAAEAGVRVIEADGARLAKLAGSAGHQGVAARVQPVEQAHSLDDLLDELQEPPLLLVLDGVTDPHNLGACLRSAEGAGVHAVIAPRDRASGLTPVVCKVASGAAETMPFVQVTNLVRTLRYLQDSHRVFVVGADGAADDELYRLDLTGPLALVMGSEGEGMRRLTRESCDRLARLPMRGQVESLNVSVATGVCLYEALRQRTAGPI